MRTKHARAIRQGVMFALRGSFRTNRKFGLVTYYETYAFLTNRNRLTTKAWRVTCARIRIRYGSL